MGAGHCQWCGLADRNILWRARLTLPFMPKFLSVGPLAVAGGAVTDGRKARKYIMIFEFCMIIADKINVLCFRYHNIEDISN